MTTATNSHGQILSAVEAARRIYNTPSPTAEQVGRVVTKIEAGTLVRGPRGGASTTVEAVAEYMARKEAAYARSHRGAGGQPGTGTRAGDPLPTLYKSLLKDYFLAVVLRRKVSHRSGGFHRAVICTQVLLLVGMLAVLGFGARRTIAGRIVSPQQRAVQAWLDSRYEEAKVLRIEVVSGGAQQVRASYSYFVNGRRIQSQQVFTLAGGKVTSVQSD